MADLWTDLQLAGILFIFIYLVKWGVGLTGSKKVGLLISIILTYLTVYQHVELLFLVIFLFFGFAFWEQFEGVFVPFPKQGGKDG